MGKEFKTFGDTDIEKEKFYRYKNPGFLNDVDIDNILISKKISFSDESYKYFIGQVGGYKLNHSA